MNAGPLPEPAAPSRPWRPERCDHVALVLQGGGALGAYQAGVYQALHEAGLEPDWVAGVSIGGINARDHRRQPAGAPAGAAARVLGDASPPGRSGSARRTATIRARRATPGHRPG